MEENVTIMYNVLNKDGERLFDSSETAMTVEICSNSCLEPKKLLSKHHSSNTLNIEQELNLTNLEQQGDFQNTHSTGISDNGDTIEMGFAAELLNENATPGEYFVVSTYEEMITVLEDYFDRTSSRFVVQKRTKGFGVTGSNFDLHRHRIQWEDTKNPNTCFEYNFLPFDGVPHITVGHYVMVCQFGHDSSAAQKRKRRELKEANKHQGKTRILKYPTKKCGCPSKIYVKQVIKFPGYKIEKKTERRKRTSATRLKEQFQLDRGSISSDVYYMGRLPVVGEHKYHELMEGREFSKESVHKDLIIKAQELYLQNYSLNEIMSALELHVSQNMFYEKQLPDKWRRKYYPSRKDVRNFIGRIRQLSRLSREEKKKIHDLIERIHDGTTTNHGILFTFIESHVSVKNVPVVDSSDGDDEEEEEDNMNSENCEKHLEETKIPMFMACYQTPDQQRLLKRYNNFTCVVQVKHNATVKRALTFKMFVLLVQTNVDYQVVGCVVFSKQRKNGLKDGLSVLKDRNLFWSPKYMLIDYSDEVNLAVSEVFPNAKCFLNIDSCEQLWNDFITTPSNDLLKHSDKIINYLRNMAYSYSENFLSQSASNFEESEVWQNSGKLRSWFQTDWLPIAKKWVAGYRPVDLFVFGHLKYNMNDCLQQYEQLISCSTKFHFGISGMFEDLHTTLVRQEHERYIERNLSALQLGINLKPDQLLANSLDGIPMLLRPAVYEQCEQAAMLNFNMVNGEQFGVFLLEALPTKSLSQFLPSSVVEHATLDSIEALQREMTGEMMAHMMDGASTNDIVPTIHFEDGDAVNGHDTSVLTAASILSSTNLNDLVENNLMTSTPKHTSDINVIAACDDVATPVSNVEEFTVSFGDENEPSFCTCSHWKQFKLPCVHMFYIFQKKREWRYDMLSSAYRMNNALNQDHICGSSVNSSSSNSNNNSNNVEKSQVLLVNNKCKCEQTVKCRKYEDTVKKMSVQTQKNLGDFGIFLPIADLNSSEKLFDQVNTLIKQLSKLSHVFRDLLYFKNLRKQLQQLSRSLWDDMIQEKIAKNLSGDINKLINNYLTKVIEQTVEPDSILTTTTITTKTTATDTVAATTTTSRMPTTTATTAATETDTMTKAATATILTVTQPVGVMTKEIATETTTAETTTAEATTITATETTTTTSPVITPVAKTTVTSYRDHTNKFTSECDDSLPTCTVLDVLDILSDAIQEDITVETSDACGDIIVSSNSMTSDISTANVHSPTLSVDAVGNVVNEQRSAIDFAEKTPVQGNLHPPSSTFSSSHMLDTLLSTPVLKAQDIVISMLKSGTKRNSQQMSCNSNDDDEFVKASFKTSILEYLPLLKKKCIDQPLKVDSA